MSEELAGRLSSLQSRVRRLDSDARMSGIEREMSDLGATVKTLPSEIEELRTRGYAFRSYLERKAEVFSEHWDEIRRRVERSADEERRSLRREMNRVERHLERAEEAESEDEDTFAEALDELDDAIDDFESEAKSAEDRIENMYATLKRDVDEHERQVNNIRWFLDKKDEATFDFLAGESVYMVANAEWVATGKGRDDPDGQLFLTDQRLIFEQNEKVGKRLGLFGGKQVQEVEWEIPLHQVEGVEFENQGFFGGKDILHFTLGGGAPYAKITIEVKGSADNKFWVKQIQRMIAGDTDDERAIEPDPEVKETLKNAPTECHVCGGTLPMLVAGQNQVECQYCGSVIRF
jgi:hypothetical protein